MSFVDRTLLGLRQFLLLAFFLLAQASIRFSGPQAERDFSQWPETVKKSRAGRVFLTRRHSPVVSDAVAGEPVLLASLAAMRRDCAVEINVRKKLHSVVVTGLLMAILMPSVSHAQENPPDDAEASDALWRARYFVMPVPGCARPINTGQQTGEARCEQAMAKSRAAYKVSVGNCESLKNSEFLPPLPTPPGAVVCAVTVFENKVPPQEHIAIFYEVAGRWNARLLI